MLHFAKIMTEIEILRNLRKNRKFIEILTKIEIFRKFAQNRNFSKISLEFLKILEIFDQNRKSFENFRLKWSKFSKDFDFLTKISKIFDCSLENLIKILTKIEIFEKLKSKFFANFRLKSRNFGRNFRKFRENYDWNRNLTKFAKKSKVYRNFDQNRDFSKICPKSKFFENFTRIENFRNFWKKSKSFENFDQNENFRKFD